MSLLGITVICCAILVLVAIGILFFWVLLLVARRNAARTSIEAQFYMLSALPVIFLPFYGVVVPAVACLFGLPNIYAVAVYFVLGLIVAAALYYGQFSLFYVALVEAMKRHPESLALQKRETRERLLWYLERRAWVLRICAPALRSDIPTLIAELSK